MIKLKAHEVPIVTQPEKRRERYVETEREPPHRLPTWSAERIETTSDGRVE